MFKIKLNQALTNRLILDLKSNNLVANCKDNRIFASVLFTKINYINDYVNNSYMAELYVATSVTWGE